VHNDQKCSVRREKYSDFQISAFAFAFAFAFVSASASASVICL
jgi:hypothetical protein